MEFIRSGECARALSRTTMISVMDRRTEPIHHERCLRWVTDGIEGWP